MLSSGDVVSAFTRRGDEQLVQRLLRAPVPDPDPPAQVGQQSA
jgi:hypothetical protein